MTSCTKSIAALARALPADQGFALIPNRKLYELYAIMVHCRILSERLLRSRQADVWPETRGLEAALVAATLDLDRDDTLAPGAGSLASCFVKGLPLASVRALLSAARARISWERYKILSPALPFETQLEAALQAAEAHRAAKNKKMAVVFCADSAAHLPLLKKAFARAGKEKLPILFLVFAEEEKDSITELANRAGFPGIVADEHDAVAVYRVVTESAAHARRGNGATLIECRPWPLTEATSDPIAKMEEALKRRGIFSRQLKTQTAALFKRALSVR